MEPYFKYVMTQEGKYYQIDVGSNTYSSVSEANFYKLSGYKKSDIEKLHKSIYPTQGNDYQLLKHEGQLFPVDYKLVPLVLYLWKHDVKTMGWNQPDEYNKGFVSMEHYTKNKESSLSFLEEKIKGLRYVVIDRQTEPFEKLEAMNKKIEAFNKKGILVIELNLNFIAMDMNDTLLEKLYKHLGLKLNNKKLPGNVIVDNDYFKYQKIRKQRA